MVQPREQTSLDPIETTVHRRRYPYWNATTPANVHTARTLVENATLPDHITKAERMLACCSQLWVGRDTQGYCLMANRCKQRGCPICDGIRGYRLAEVLSARLKTYAHPKFLTLTLKTRDVSLRAQVQFLLAAFNRLRRYSVWKQLAGRGAYAIEITRNSKTKAFHVHLHAILNAKYIPQHWISDTWKSITGGSYIVHIRTADDRAAKYLGKYMAKSSTAPLEPFELWPYRDELHGLRLAAAFGGEPALALDETTGELPADPIAPLRVVVSAALDGDRVALRILSDLQARYPRLFASIPEPSTADPPKTPRSAKVLVCPE